MTIVSVSPQMEKTYFQRRKRKSFHKHWNQLPQLPSITRTLGKRQLGLAKSQVPFELFQNHHAAKVIPYRLEEKQISLGHINKVFASKWLSDKEIVFGTKCNKLIVLNLSNDRKFSIPMLSSKASYPFLNSGIHSISINPSQNLLATGGDNPNTLAIYSLPSFDPVCIGECHQDWVFGVRWLDDEFVVTAIRQGKLTQHGTVFQRDPGEMKRIDSSRDATVALWKVGESVFNSSEACKTTHSNCSYCTIEPCVQKECSLGDKVRALEFNTKRRELATLTSDGFITIWDVVKFKQILTEELELKETVCVGLSEDHSLYVVGSQSHISFLDPRRARCIERVSSREESSGVRSVNFRGELLSVGTGKGVIKFFDLRKNAFLLGEKTTHHLQMGDGWLSRDEVFYEFFSNTRFPNAVYTHSYDDSGTRLFAAGGPLPSGLTGNYAGLFH